MSRLSDFGHNFKLLFDRDWASQFLEHEQKLDTRINDFEQRNDVRARAYEQAFDERVVSHEQAFDERVLRYEEAFDQRVDRFEQTNQTRMDGYEHAVDLRLDEREEATRKWLEERHAALDKRLDEREELVDQRLDVFEAALTERLTTFEEALNKSLNQFTTTTSQRLDKYETAITERLNDRDAAVDERLDERFAAEQQAADKRASAYETSLDQRFDERFTTFEKRADTRSGELEIHLDQRFDERMIAVEKLSDERTARFELQLDQQLDERFATLDQRSDERLNALETRGESRLAELMRTFEVRFDERTHALEVRADGRLNALDKHLDDRFVRLEKTADTRMETHERRVDGKLKTNREDLVDRTDVMLQLFEQRLDEQRRALRHLREQLAPRKSSPKEAVATEPLPELPDLKDVLQETPAGQVQSFRKLAEGYHPLPAHKLPKAETALYHRILDWKKVAHEGLTDFTPDEKEVVDYVLSFISDAAERHYVMQHMRRFLSTLERIPPPQRSTDRLLELGSLLHYVPALSKYTGYQIVGADFWESDEKVSTETLKQVKGKDVHQVELSNFNVEADKFPYPDQHFRVVLCCELIEHLQRDPLHMLWECNRVLQDDGFLLLTTPNIASARSIEGLLITCSPYLLSQYNRETPVDQHNHEYAPYEVGVALAAAGFTVVALEAEDVWLRSNPAIIELLAQLEISTDLRGDNLFALARKTSAPIERFPKELYVQ
ncbi:MAG: methyltransferase domain-containing protein [Acidobacteria bacterium]|nr:methyltransferase domain-containing protein [Acidobacteriota bacterium]